MELLAAITTTVNGFWEPGFEGRPAPYAVTASHRVRFARRHVTAVAAIAQYVLPNAHELLAPASPTGMAGFAQVGYRRGTDGQWVQPGVVLGRFDDCTGVSLHLYVVQGWISGNAMVFDRGASLAGLLRLETVRLVFDARTGMIAHTLASSVLEGEDAGRDDTDLDGEALREAREHAPPEMHLRVRPYERLLTPGGVFRVDPDTGAVVEVRR